MSARWRVIRTHTCISNSRRDIVSRHITNAKREREETYHFYLILVQIWKEKNQRRKKKGQHQLLFLLLQFGLSLKRSTNRMMSNDWINNAEHITLTARQRRRDINKNSTLHVLRDASTFFRNSNRIGEKTRGWRVLVFKDKTISINDQLSLDDNLVDDDDCYHLYHRYKNDSQGYYHWSSKWQYDDNSCR